MTIPIYFAMIPIDIVTIPLSFTGLFFEKSFILPQKQRFTAETAKTAEKRACPELVEGMLIKVNKFIGPNCLASPSMSLAGASLPCGNALEVIRRDLTEFERVMVANKGKLDVFPVEVTM